jgi:formylglycine-generating enzyme required for sulfatase activity
MVPAGSFCIDQTEVTNAQYHDFVAANPPTSDQPAECAWNGSWVPFNGQWTYQNTTASYPITGVNWCQAYMFCKWAGKHLCGAPDGGSATSWASSAYYSACSHGGAHVFPYGDALDAGACNGVEGGADASVPVPITTCAGGYPGLFDMVGNVQEWIDHCDKTDSGQNDSCFLSGSSYGFGDPSCPSYVGLPRDGLYDDLGFRCCSP